MIAQAHSVARSVRVFTPDEGMQDAFCNRWETEVFYGGEAGGGKSMGLLLDVARHLVRPGYKAIIFRLNYPDLEELIHRAQEIFTAPGMWGRYHAQSHTFHFPNGSFLKFRHLEHVNDVYKYQGQEYDYVGFDELPQFPRFCYLYLFSRVRGPADGTPRFVRSTGQADGPGKLWVKARFIDPLQPLETGWFTSGQNDSDLRVRAGTPHAISRCFVPSRRSENFHIDRREYEARLHQLPEAQRTALLEGRWTLPDSKHQLVLGKWLERALSGKVKYNGGLTWALGMDYARDGGDRTVIVTGRGNQPRRVEWWPRTKTTEAAKLLAERIDIYGYQCVAALDTVGVGGGVFDSLKEYHPKQVDRVTSMDHKDAGFDERYRRAFGGRYRFESLRSQMAWKLREDLEYERIDLSFLQRPEGYFPELPRMMQEVLAHTYDTPKGVITVIGKDRLSQVDLLGWSPDFYDAIALWNFIREREPQPPPGRKLDRDPDYGLREFEATNKRTTHQPLVG